MCLSITPLSGNYILQQEYTMHMLKNCYEYCRYNIAPRMRLSGKYSIRQSMPSAVFVTRLHPSSCILLHNATIHCLWCFSLLILFADLLLFEYPEPSKKVYFKEYIHPIHHCSCKSQ